LDEAPSEPTLTVSISDFTHLELESFASSFGAFADEYTNYITESRNIAVSSDVHLYIKEVRAGSIIAVLHAFAPTILPFAENASSIIGFTEHIKLGFKWLLGHAGPRPDHVNKQSIENLSKIVEPIAKDNAAMLNVGTNYGVIYNVHLSVSSPEAKKIQNAAIGELLPTREAATGRHNRVVLYLYQARNTPKSGAGDTGKIDSISTGPVRVIFEDDNVKAQILSNSENPFKLAYLIDVEVETMNERPVLYKVLTLHEVISPPEFA
jgi:hypothetical protein